MLLDQHTCDVPAGFVVGRRQGLVFRVRTLASDRADDFIGRLRGVSAVGVMRFFFLQDLLNSLELRIIDGPAVVINLVLHFPVGYDFLRVSSLLDVEAVIAAHVVVVALLLGEALEGVVDAQTRLQLFSLLLLPGQLVFIRQLRFRGLNDLMRLGRVSMLLPLLLLLFCGLGLCAVLILHFHELLNLLLVEVLTEIPLPLGNLNLQTPRPLRLLPIPPLRPASFLRFPLSRPFLSRLPT